MKKILIASLIIFSSCKFIEKEFTTKELDNKIEKLEQSLNTTEIDTTKMIKLLLIKSERFGKKKEIDKARKKINEALNLSKDLNNETETANCLFQLSKIEFKYGVPQIAELSMEKAKEIYKRKKMRMKLIELNAFGIELYNKLGKKEKVEEILNEAKSL